MRNRMYGGVRGRKTKVGEKLLRFPPTRLVPTERTRGRQRALREAVLWPREGRIVGTTGWRNPSLGKSLTIYRENKWHVSGLMANFAAE